MAVGPWGVTSATLPGGLPPAIQAYVQRSGEETQQGPRLTPSSLIDPMEQIAPPAPPDVNQEPGAGDTPVPTFGLGRLQQQMEDDAGTPLMDAEAKKRMGAGYDAQRSAAAAMGTKFGETQGALTALAATEQNLAKNQQEALTAARTKMERANKLSQYPSLTPDEIDQQETIANDSEGRYTPEQRRAAQLSLKRASEIDPNRLMNSSTRNRVLAIVAQAMGAAGASLQHGRVPNYGAQLVEAAIERDILAQKSAFDSTDRAAQRQRNIYGDLMKQFDNEFQAINAQKSMLLGMSEVMARKYGAEQLAGELAVKKEESEGKVAQMEAANRLDNHTRAADVANKRMQGKLEDKRLQLIAEKQDQVGGDGFIPGGAQPDGSGKKVPKMSANSPIVKSLDAYNGAMPVLDALIAEREEFGPEVLNRYGVRDMRALHAMLRGTARKILGTGAHLSPEESKDLDALLSADPTDTGFIQSTLQSFRQALRMHMNGQLKTYHLKAEDDVSQPAFAPPTPGGR